MKKSRNFFTKGSMKDVWMVYSAKIIEQGEVRRQINEGYRITWTNVIMWNTIFLICIWRCYVFYCCMLSLPPYSTLQLLYHPSMYIRQYILLSYSNCIHHTLMATAMYPWKRSQNIIHKIRIPISEKRVGHTSRSIVVENRIDASSTQCKSNIL